MYEPLLITEYKNKNQMGVMAAFDPGTFSARPFALSLLQKVAVDPTFFPVNVFTHPNR
jgi:hypothetical protein